jgi:hypothetical protein
MDRQAPNTELHGVTIEHRCILCEGVIEVVEYDVYFATGYCRFCHAVIEEDE